ncbi:hypothetical protein H2509_00400 [Stappia sp. F7233]|uniref:Uncharacterized protein n=1 Tax=Stappia albiluteola TaxID=2758565 RepID=A0A839A945_9HYPH|nr:hypothetical protein [Stappia albiluteola]MBA5775578.1 hypothetical protein [Stappia albiluteola]
MKRLRTLSAAAIVATTVATVAVAQDSDGAFGPIKDGNSGISGEMMGGNMSGMRGMMLMMQQMGPMMEACAEMMQAMTGSVQQSPSAVEKG